uniref:Uncharacterized protein n=1 Tax=Amphimedon queenslandica TaxID=400682 RepID=A0A1X7U4D5_AMPQE
MHCIPVHAYHVAFTTLHAKLRDLQLTKKTQRKKDNKVASSDNNKKTPGKRGHLF